MPSPPLTRAKVEQRARGEQKSIDRSLLVPVVKSIPRTIGAIVEDCCTHPESTTAIITCCRRSRFFEQLALHVLSTAESSEGQEAQQQYLNLNPTAGEGTEDREPALAQHTTSTLLEPTLQLLATSLNTSVVFCSSIPSFRAYVSTLPVRGKENGGNPSKVVIVDMLALHHGTSEFTVQGLSRTFAMLAAVNTQMASEVQLIECNDLHDLTDPSRGVRLWNAEVPLLSGSVKIGEAGQGWASRTTSIKSLAERWFHFA